MQRLFSAFPGRWPGIGLVLLRAAVGPLLVLQGAAYLSDSPNGEALAWLSAILALATGVALVIGFITPVAGVAGGLLMAAEAMSWLPARAEALGTGPAWLLLAVVSLALSFLGPGAFSLDSYLFGRREIVFPADARR